MKGVSDRLEAVGHRRVRLLRNCVHKTALMLTFLAASPAAFSQTATRGLPPNYAPPPSTLEVSISLSIPGGTGVVGVEDGPPSGWAASNISNGGTYDVPSGKVKWGPFIAPSIPSALTYEVTPNGPGGSDCFVGTASFDGLDVKIGGDACMIAVPAASFWGLVVMSELLLISATLTLLRRAAV